MKKLIILLFVFISCKKTNTPPASPLSYTKKMAGGRGWIYNEYSRGVFINGSDTTFYNDTVINQTVLDSIRVLDDSTIIWGGGAIKFESYDTTSKTIKYYRSDPPVTNPKNVHKLNIIYYYNKDSITIDFFRKYMRGNDSTYYIYNAHTL